MHSAKQAALAAGAKGPFYIACISDGPKRLEAPPPHYPEPARAAGVEGVVIVQAVIEADGTVGEVKVLRGLPLGLDQAAVDAVHHWKFRPARFGGRPVAVYYTLSVEFRLDS